MYSESRVADNFAQVATTPVPLYATTPVRCPALHNSSGGEATAAAAATINQYLATAARTTVRRCQNITFYTEIDLYNCVIT